MSIQNTVSTWEEVLDTARKNTFARIVNWRRSASEF